MSATDSRDPRAGSTLTNAAGSAGDDGDPCTDGEACLQGACGGTGVWGLILPPSSDGGKGNGCTGGALPVLSATAKGHIKVVCLGPKKATCRSILFALATSSPAAGTLARGGQLAKPRHAKIGKKGQVVLKIKLNKDGRSALTAAANQLPVLLDTTVTDRDGTSRETTVTAMLVCQTEKK